MVTIVNGKQGTWAFAVFISLTTTVHFFRSFGEMNTVQTYLCLLSSRGRRGSSLAYLSLDGGLSRTECVSPL